MSGRVSGGDLAFAAMLRALRLASCMTQGALARKAGVSRVDVSRWERGVGRAPTDNQVHRLMVALGKRLRAE